MIRATLVCVVLLATLQLSLGIPARNRRADPLKPQKVVAGGNTGPMEFPHQARLRYSSGSFDNIFCGGTLINPRYVLTAKHCVEGSSPDSITVVLGDFNRKSYESTEQSIRVQQIKYHPQYDMALLLLSSPSTVAPATLSSQEPTAGTDMIVTGWGWTQSNGGSQSLADVLQKLTIPIQDRSVCLAEGIGAGSHQLCAGRSDGTYMNACHGDSGGPLVYWNGQGWTLVGMVEKGHGGCPEYVRHAVYVNVAFVRSWILANDDIPAPAPPQPQSRRGCFPGSAMISLKNGGDIQMSELRIGDEVEATTLEGATVYSEVLMMFDSVRSGTLEYYVIETAASRDPIAVSPLHLIAVSKSNATFHPVQFVFAKDVDIGDYLLVSNAKVVRPSQIIKITKKIMDGVFAPMTREGTINVNHVMASCYASNRFHRIAHMAMAPIRWADDLMKSFSISKAKDAQIGTHWYGTLWETFASPLVHN